MSSLQAVTAPAKEWIAALSRLTPATTGKRPAPILFMARINPTAASMFAVGNGGTAETAVDAAPGMGEPFLVSYRWLRDAITSTTGRDRNAPVTVAADGKQVTLEACGYKLHFETMPVNDFPELVERHVFESHISVEAADLRVALDRALVAASTDDMLPVLASVHFKSSPAGLTLWSTDRYRLTSSVVPGHGFGETSFTVPFSFLKPLVKQIRTGQVDVDTDKLGNIIIRAGGTEFVVAGIAADYPKIGELFDRVPTTVADVNRVQLLEAAKVAHHMSGRNTPTYLSIREDGISVSFNDGVFGPDVAPLAGGSLTGEPVEVAFNAFYLLGAMNTFKGETVRLHGGNPAKQFTLTDGDANANDANAYRHLLMPVRMPRG